MTLSFYVQVDLNSKMRAEEKRINDLWDKNRIEMAKKGTLLERAEKRERQGTIIFFSKIDFNISDETFKRDQLKKISEWQKNKLLD